MSASRACSPPSAASSGPGRTQRSPPWSNAARLAIVDASRIQAELASHHAHERKHIDWVINDLAKQEAAAAAPEPAVQRPSPPRESAPQRRPAPIGLPTAARQRPADSPPSAPRAPHSLLASAAVTPLALPGLPQAATARAFGARHGEARLSASGLRR